MAVYCISDLHLSSSGKKPMDVFGARWQGHMQRLIEGFADIGDDDTVVIPGDLSWGDSAEDAKNDFLFLSSLGGKKIVGKGNHDFWWATLPRMQSFVKELGISNISFLRNNAYICEDIIVCGTKGYLPVSGGRTADDKKYGDREATRLELSLKSGLALDRGEGRELVVFLHYPPVYGTQQCEQLLDVIYRYRIGRVFYGHIHSVASGALHTSAMGASLRLIAADALGFKPLKIST